MRRKTFKFLDVVQLILEGWLIQICTAVHPMKCAHSLCFVLFLWPIQLLHFIYLVISFRITSLALGQSQDCLLDLFIYPYSSGVLHWHWANHRIVLFELFIYPYPSGLLHWQWGNKIAPVPVKQSWMIWVNELKLVHNTWDAISILVKYFEFEFVCERYSPHLKFTFLTSWTILLSIHLPEL